MGEIIFLLLISGLCGLYYRETLGYVVPKYDKTGGAAIFPQLIIALLLVFCLVRIITILIKKEKKHFVFFELFKGTTGVFFISFLVYVLTMRFIGFVVGTSLFLIWTSSFLKFKADGTIGSARYLTVLSISMIAVAVAVSLFFSGLLNVRIPAGIWGSLF